MKKFINLALFVSGIMALHSCQSGSSSSSNKSGGIAASSNISGDEGSYSFKVADKEVNEKGTLMTGYKADLSTDDGVKILSLVLTNASAADGSVSSFMFAIPNKTGATTFTKENDKVNDTAYSCVYTGAPGHGADIKIDPHINNITITIDRLTDARVSGTFSGTVIGEDGSSLLPVTDGKFNLPVYKHQ